MTRDEYLTELQRLIAREKGYTDLRKNPWDGGSLYGTLHADEGPTLVPRWSQDWCAAGELVEEMRTSPGFIAYSLRDSRHRDDPSSFELVINADQPLYYGWGYTAQEVASRCWLAWKGVGLSDLPPVVP